MKKQLQLQINKAVENEYEKLVNELNETDCNNFYKYPWFKTGKNFGKQLRSCQAYVMETETYYVLKSYNTIIACINKSNDTLYDFLRMVYGYTATSAKHISIFNKDYCKGNWNCSETYTYRTV